MDSVPNQIDDTAKQDHDVPVLLQDVPVLLQSKKNACKMLQVGSTKLDDLIAEGVLEKVSLGRHVHITTKSIYAAARTPFAANG
jgi:hypothetical protein